MYLGPISFEKGSYFNRRCKLITQFSSFQNANRVPYFCRFHVYARRGILSHILPEHATGASVNSPKVLPKKLPSHKSTTQSMSSSSSSSSYSSTSSNAVRPKRVCLLTLNKIRCSYIYKLIYNQYIKTKYHAFYNN